MTRQFAISALRRGVSIEQFLGPVAAAGRRGIRWVTLEPTPDGVNIVEHAAELVDRDGFRDLDNFPPFFDDEDRAWGWVVGSSLDGAGALDMARDLVGAVDDRWVNSGVAGDDYVDYLRGT